MTYTLFVVADLRAWNGNISACAHADFIIENFLVYALPIPLPIVLYYTFSLISLLLLHFSHFAFDAPNITIGYFIGFMESSVHVYVYLIVICLQIE